MATSGFSVGDKVVHVANGTRGTVMVAGPGGDVGVRWEAGDVIQMVVPTLLRRA